MDELAGDYEFTYDWYCSGYPGSSPLTLNADGTCDIGGYTGFWGVDVGPTDVASGLCEGGNVDIDVFFGFDNYATIYAYDITDAGASGYHDDLYYNGENADGATVLTASDGGCPEGTVDDCSGDGDCCGESWIGDGLCDGEDQAWGCDLTCYDNDGGDCDEDPEPECDEDQIDDDFYYPEELVGDYIFTYDWYCSGYPGSSSLTLHADGTADIGGYYTGYWGPGPGLTYFDAGLCPQCGVYDVDLWFAFDNYATQYAYNLSLIHI